MTVPANEKRLRDLLREVTADCHDEEEQFWSIFYALAEDGLDFPLQARALGEPVEVVDLDGARSGLRCGIVALVRKKDREYPVALAELEFVGLDTAGAEWADNEHPLDMYRYWLKLR
jgi:hypothetical protein